MNHVFVISTDIPDHDKETPFDETIKKVKMNLEKVIDLEGWKVMVHLDAAVDSGFHHRLVEKSNEPLEQKLDLQYRDTFQEFIDNIEARRFMMTQFPDAALDDTVVKGRGKFQVEIPLDRKDEFYTRMLINGWAFDCFNFMLMVNSANPDYNRQVLEWMAMAKKTRDEEKVPG